MKVYSRNFRLERYISKVVILEILCRNATLRGCSDVGEMCNIFGEKSMFTKIHAYHQEFFSSTSRMLHPSPVQNWKVSIGASNLECKHFQFGTSKSFSHLYARHNISLYRYCKHCEL